LAEAFATTERIYTHSKRDEWGYAILAFERADRRAYQFQDGRLRLFKKGYYDLLEQAEPEDDEARNIVKNLKSMLKNARAMREELAGGTDDPTVTFEAIVTLFREVHPEGFAGDSYRKRIRGRDAKRRLKRHIDPAIDDARKALSPDTLDALAEAGDHAAVRDRLLEVLRATSLVSKKQLEPLEKLGDEHLETLTRALREMLYGVGPYEARFERFVRALGRSGDRVGWELATAPCALVSPGEHVFVKASTWKPLIDRFATHVGFSRTPSAYLYRRLQRLAEQLVAQLRDADLEPEDFFDVHQLVWSVMRPKMRKRLDADAAAANA